MANVFGVIKRPVVTEKGMTAKETSQTLCFEVMANSNKNEIKHAVEAAFKVKVAEVRTSTTAGKLRRRGKFSGYRADWKKAWVRLKTGQKMPEYSEI